jgi:hypothetical protein
MWTTKFGAPIHKKTKGENVRFGKVLRLAFSFCKGGNLVSERSHLSRAGKRFSLEKSMKNWDKQPGNLVPTLEHGGSGV